MISLYHSNIDEKSLIYVTKSKLTIGQLVDVVPFESFLAVEVMSGKIKQRPEIASC